MAFENCKLNEEELREYNPGYPYMEKVFIPGGGTIDRDNDIRLFKYGNGPLREPSDLYQFIFDYKGIPLKVQLKRELKDGDIYWCDSFIEVVKNVEIDYSVVEEALREAMKVYAYIGYNHPELMKKNEKKVHINF